MLNYTENRKNFKKLRQAEPLPTILVGLVGLLMACFLAFAIRFTCLGIVKLHNSTTIQKGK